MQTQITISQGDSQVSFSFEHADNKSRVRIRRRLLFQFIDWYDTMRQVKARSFKGNQALRIQMQGAVSFDTGSLSMEAQTVLKLQNTAKGRTSFLRKLDVLVCFMQRLNEGEQVHAEYVEKELLSVEA